MELSGTSLADRSLAIDGAPTGELRLDLSAVRYADIVGVEALVELIRLWPDRVVLTGLADDLRRMLATAQLLDVIVPDGSEPA